MWKLQICKENEDMYHDYIVASPKKMYNNNVLIGNSLHGLYYGSSTRINEIGTIYYGTTQDKQKIKIRLLDENDNNLFEYQLTDYDIHRLAKLDLNNNHIISKSHRIENVEIYCRDLHKWKNYPYEISGITIYN